MSNMGAIVLARYHKMPEVKKTGLSGIPPFAIFTSQDVRLYYFMRMFVVVL